MKLTIDNNQRKFLVQSQSFGNYRDIICNLKQIPEVLKTQFEKNEDFKIFEFWNRKFKRCSKKHLNEMFIANQVNFKIN